MFKLAGKLKDGETVQYQAPAKFTVGKATPEIAWSYIGVGMAWLDCVTTIIITVPTMNSESNTCS